MKPCLVPLLLATVLPSAIASAQTMDFACPDPGTTFTYEVIPLWERPVEHFLNGPLGITPDADALSGNNTIYVFALPQ